MLPCVVVWRYSSPSHPPPLRSSAPPLRLRFAPSFVQLDPMVDTTHGFHPLTPHDAPSFMAYKRLNLIRNLIIILILFVFFNVVALSLAVSSAPSVSALDGLAPAGSARILCAVMLALCSCVVLSDVTVGAFPYLDKHKFHVTNTPLGSLTYLTFEGVTSQFVCYTSNAIAEVALAANGCDTKGSGSLAEQSEWLCPSARRVVFLTHAAATFAGALGCIVSILFFVLVWNGPDFKAVRRYWDKHVGGFSENMIRGHVPPLLLAIVDITVVKRRALLSSIPVNDTVIAMCFALAYLILVNTVSYLNGGYYPYPFMTEFLGRKPLRWIVFYFAVTGFALSVTAALKMLSRHYTIWP